MSKQNIGRHQTQGCSAHECSDGSNLHPDPQNDRKRTQVNVDSVLISYRPKYQSDAGLWRQLRVTRLDFGL